MKYLGLYILLFSFFIAINATPLGLSKRHIPADTYFKFQSKHKNTIKRSVLICDKHPHGSHPSPAASCNEITKFHGNLIAALNQGNDDCICTAIYDPVSVSIIGKYKGKPFKFNNTFGNPCELGCKIDKVQHFFNI
ncbi:unnamed protein product [Cunninghamella blakesleeana]